MLKMSQNKNTQVNSSIEKDIEKTILFNGKIGEKPMLGTASKIVISDLNIQGNHNTTDFLTLNKCNLEQILISGEADTNLDRKLEQCVENMLEKESSRFVVKLNGSTYTFVLYLISFEFNGYFFEWVAGKKYAFAQQYKSRGVELFKLNRPVDAFYRFSRAIKLLMTCVLEVDDTSKTIDGVQIDDIESLKIVLFSNIASCHYQVKNYEDVIELCTKVLLKDNTNVKALYKRGMSYIEVRDFEKAEADMSVFLKFKPNNTDAKQALMKIRKELALSHEKFVEFCERIFR